MLEELRQQAQTLTEELIKASKIQKDEILVVGCSTSEVLGHKIGSYSSADAGQAIFNGVYAACCLHGIYPAAQCCEHLNRAIIIDAAAAVRYSYEPVNVIPQPKAGGSFATAAYHTLKHPVAVEEIQAHAGMDIGDTLIGMHLRRVAVPLRLPEYSSLGEAHVVFARTRARFIGGVRAMYDESLL